MKKKKVVVIDLGKSDIIYCLSDDTKTTTTITNKEGKIISNKTKDYIQFRYTQNQRRLETRNKKYLKIDDRLKKTIKVFNKSLNEIEREIKRFSKIPLRKRRKKKNTKKVNKKKKLSNQIKTRQSKILKKN